MEVGKGGGALAGQARSYFIDSAEVREALKPFEISSSVFLTLPWMVERTKQWQDAIMPPERS